MNTKSFRKATILGAQLGLYAIVLSAFTATNAMSEEGRNVPLAAHEHGHGELMIAQDGQDVLLELRLPGADVVGFEHAPENHEQEHAVEIAMKNLKDAAEWLRLTDEAKCRIEDAHVSSPLASALDDHAHDAQKEDHGDHADERKDEHDDHADETHAEFMAEYHVHCAAPERLSGVDLGLFKVFPSLEEIDYQAVVSKGQYGGKLDASQPGVRF